MNLVNAPWIQRARKLKNMTPREISNFQTIFKTIQNRFEKHLSRKKSCRKPKKAGTDILPLLSPIGKYTKGNNNTAQ